METIRAAQPHPVTRDMLVADLVALGVSAGSTLVVHSSLSSLGWVSGGPQAVVLAQIAPFATRSGRTSAERRSRSTTTRACGASARASAGTSSW